MTYWQLSAILVFLTAFLASSIAYPFVLRFAKRHNIVDNPDARKLQRVPVPVLGSVVVYIGIVAGMIVLFLFMKEPMLISGFVAMTFLMILGIWDDMKNLSASLRFLLEVVIVLLFILTTGVYVDDLHGLFGIGPLEPRIGISFTVFCGVTLINAFNLIDGVDGYSSGYGMMVCVLFSLMFHSVWGMTMVEMAIIVAGALLPFFMHNVFGVRSKMFIGDGGTLMLGMLMVVFVCATTSSKSPCSQLVKDNLSLHAMCVAVFCIPVFDTLRVFIMRMMRGKSPFRPDKTHLHHLFIDMGFSHLGAALSILTLNLTVVGLWYLSWKLGASINLQAYIVAGLGFLVTFVFYKVMKIQQNGGPLDEEGFPQGTALWHWFCYLGVLSHREKGRVWRFFRWLMDTRFMSRARLFRK